MDIGNTMRSRRENIATEFAILLLAATPLATVLSRSIAFVLLISVMCLLAFSLSSVSNSIQDNRRDKVIRQLRSFDNWSTLLVITAIAFATLSLAWTSDPVRGLGALTQTTVAALVTGLCCVIISTELPLPGWTRWALLISIIAACLVTLSELALNSPLRDLIGGSTHANRLNRAAVSVAIMMPLLLLVPWGRFRAVLNVGLVLLTWFTAFSSLSESAKLAILVASVVWACSIFMRPTLLLKFCALGVISFHVFAPFIGWAIYTFVPPDAFAALGYASHHVRATIWWAYASEIWNAPFFGHGLQASYSSGEAYLGANYLIQRGLNYAHPHNFSIQVWYELGIVGIVFSTALIVLFIRRMFALPDNHKVVATALMTSIWSVAYVSHGAWQHWWWALVGIVIILFVVLARLDKDNEAQLIC